MEEIARLALEGDYSFFIPSLRISKESLEVLSLLLCGGEEMGRVDPLQQVIPSSFLEESGYYDVFNLIILIENNITISSFSHWIRQSESLYRPVLFNRSHDELCINASHSDDTLYILKCKQCLVEDETQYSYPAFSCLSLNEYVCYSEGLRLLLHPAGRDFWCCDHPGLYECHSLSLLRSSSGSVRSLLSGNP